MNQENLFNQIHSRINLTVSWLQVKKNKGAAGVDFQTIQKAQNKIEHILEMLEQRIKKGTYKTKPVKRVYIPKANNKQRPIGIPTVQDRIVQQAVRNIIEPIIDPMFEDFSYGFRPGKSAKQALAKIEELLHQKQRWIIQVDLESFFDTIPHELIIEKLQKHIKEKKVIKLIQGFLKSGIMKESIKHQSTTGTPQGGVISPLLANLVLDELDKYTKSQGIKMVRYADDFIVLTKTKRQAEHVRKGIIKKLEQLKLKVNQEKTRISHVSEEFNFLGYTFGGGEYHKGDGGTKVTPVYKRPSSKAIKRLKDKIRILTRRQQPRNIVMIKEQLNPVIRGWYNYFKHGKNTRRFKDLDGWYRMRLRSFIHKRKSYLDNTKYPNAFFKEKGYLFLSDLFLVSIKELALIKSRSVQLTLFE